MNKACSKIIAKFRTKALLLAGCFLAVAAGMTGCDSKSAGELDKLTVFSGAGQYAFPGEDFEKMLHVRAENRKSEPVGGQKLQFAAAAGSDLSFSAVEAVTDAGGVVSVRVKAGKKTGDNYLVITPDGAPKKAITVKFTVGVKLIGDAQEGRAGNSLKNPLGVKVVGSDGAPKSGVPVYVSAAKGTAADRAKIGTASLVTDQNGEAFTEITLPGATGQSNINIEVAGSGFDNMLRAIPARALSINFYALVINVLGGLAIFVLGMKMMSDGITRIAGDGMRNILHFCSRNRLVAVLAGAAVTAIIQSSSATTVMVIGFVNAGLLSLAQSIGIIFGANIGTTITAQIVAFDVGMLAMPAIIVGLVLIFVTWQKLRGWGDAILGFGLLFFGMSMMSNDLKEIGSFPSFIEFFRTFDCSPVDGRMPPGALLGAIGIGVAVTMVVQSSSAATGIIIALGGSGLINLYTALALVLGSNIGTTVTAQLASLAANRIAKQTAMAHTLFNVIGVVMVSASFCINWGGTGIPVFFYIVDSVTTGNAFAVIPQNVPRHIANAHTLFNVFTTLLLLPFAGVLVKICEFLIPVGDKKIKYQYLEPNLLENPSLAIEQANFALRKMLRKSWKMVDSAVNEHFIPVSADEKGVNAIRKKEQRIDRYQLEIMEYLSQIMQRKLSASQSEVIPPLMHCTNDAERIADRAENIIDLTIRLKSSDTHLSKYAKEELDEVFKLLKRQDENAFDALENGDAASAKEALALERKIAVAAEKFEDTHIRRLNTGDCTPVTGIIYVELLAELVAVSRHLSNVAERAMQIKESAYIGNVKKVSSDKVESV